jgi:hypothetical protein
MSSEKTLIIRSRTNAELCKITYPYNTMWSNSDAVAKWVWLQAWTISSLLTENGVIKRGDAIPSNFKSKCLICKRDTCLTVSRSSFWSSKHTFMGFACTNNNCIVYKVLIPSMLLTKIEEIPQEHLPWNKTDVKVDSKKSGT